MVGSLVACVHCGMCNEACHYVLSHPDDPKMTPSFKADQLRKIFKYNYDWTGHVSRGGSAPRSRSPTPTSRCSRTSPSAPAPTADAARFNCPMGVDTATLNRIMRGLLTPVGVMPEGVRVVSKDQWEIGNQMGVLKEDYLDTLDWMSEELVEEVGDPNAAIPIDTAGGRHHVHDQPARGEVRPAHDRRRRQDLLGRRRELDDAVARAGTRPTSACSRATTQLGGAAARRLYDKAKELGVKQVVISECGHGYRSTRCEAPNWAGIDDVVPMESLGVHHAALHQGGPHQGRPDELRQASHLPRLLQPRP